MTMSSNAATAALPPALWSAAVARVARRAQRGAIDVVFPSGGRLRFEAGTAGPLAAVQVQSPRLLWRLWSGGALGFADAYISGDCDTPDLEAVLRWALANEPFLAPTLRSGPAARLAALAHRLRPNTRRGSRRNIYRHYDLGNAFYSAWLDRTMTYSAAWFGGRDDIDLEAAQLAKYERIATLAGLRPGQRVLEIGCGWGGFAMWAARTRGCHVTAITVSAAQHAHARQRVAAEGLGDRVDVRLLDYRDVEGTWDRIVSIEMMEAVGERFWPLYAATLRDRLANGGRAVLQVITIDETRFEEYRRRADFIQAYVFPGGMLPSRTVVAQLAKNAGLALAEDIGFGRDYAITLRHWRERFEAAWPQVHAQGFDERFRRLWRYYLTYCEVGFDTGRIDVRLFACDRP